MRIEIYKMDRNSIIGLILIFVILVTFAYINQPDEGELRALKQKQDSIELVRLKQDSVNASIALEQMDSVSTTNLTDSTSQTNQFGMFSRYANGTEEFTTIENKELKVILTNKGGRVYSVELKNHKRSDKSPLVLFDGADNEFYYSFATKDAKAISTKDLYFNPVISSDAKSISMLVKLSDESYIEHRYAFEGIANQLSCSLNFVGMNEVIASNISYLDFYWKQNILQQEKTHAAEERTTTIYYRYAEDEPDFISETKEAREDLKTPVQWISFKQQYFNTSLVATSNFENGTIETKNDPSKKFVKVLSANMSIPFDHKPKESFNMSFYYGPNHYKTLESLDIGLERVVPMGWGIFRWVNKYITVNVFAYLEKYIVSFGIIILLLTVIIKTILFPLVYKSYLSAAKMKVLKPEIDEIKEKYGNDMAKIQQENMKLYRKAGVNPLGGCVPVLLQMPVLIAMFQFFPSAFELRQKAFLWASDLSTYDSIFNLPFEIPFYGAHVSLFTLLMTISTLIYTIYNNQMTGVTGQMKWISYIMPVAFLGFFNSFASGLTYYYFVSNVITIGQQLLIRAFVDDDKLHKQIQEQRKKPVTKSKFQTKLEEMAKKRGISTESISKKK